MCRVMYWLPCAGLLLVLLLHVPERAAGVQDLDKTQDLATKFVAALKAKDLDGLVKLAGLPWLTEDRKIIKDEPELRTYLQQQIDKTDVGKLKLQAAQSLAFPELRKEVKTEADKKLLDQVMKNDDRVVVLISKEPLGHRYVLVRTQQGILKVVGGPFKFTFMIAQNTIPADIWNFMEAAGEFEVLALVPTPDKKNDGAFHDYPYVGKTVVKDAETRKALVAALKQGIEESDGSAEKGFKPGYGLRIAFQGKVLDFVISFSHLQAKVYSGDKMLGEVRLTASPQATFDQVLKKAGVPLPGKSEK
jgi:hypothetical protein